MKFEGQLPNKEQGLKWFSYQTEIFHWLISNQDGVLNWISSEPKWSFEFAILIIELGFYTGWPQTALRFYAG